MRPRQKPIKKKNLARLTALGSRIKERRLVQRFSQEELAAVLEVDRGYLGLIENGKANPTADLLYRIQDVLEMDIFL